MENPSKEVAEINALWDTLPKNVSAADWYKLLTIAQKAIVLVGKLEANQEAIKEKYIAADAAMSAMQPVEPEFRSYLKGLKDALEAIGGKLD